MPFELSDSLKNTFGMTFKSRGMNTIFSNKIYTAIIITIIIIILITVIYPCKKGTPFWILGKLGLYTFISSLAIIFIHDSVIHSNYQKNTSANENNEFISSLGSSGNPAFSKDSIPIEPAIGRYVGGKYNSDTDGGVSNNPEEVFAMYGV